MDRGEQEKKAGSALLEELKNRILFFDGGTGSLLQAAGLGAGELPETWNISHPETVVKIHRDYLNAGCDMVKTNTFNGMRLPDIRILHEDGSWELVKEFGYKDFRDRLS